MKPKKNKNAVVPSPAITPPSEVPPDQKKILEFRQLTNQAAYFAKLSEFEKTDPGGKRYEQTIKFIHELFEQEEWFSENTPYDFKRHHWSKIADLAYLICGYLKKIALADSPQAVEQLGFLTVEMTETLTQLLTVKSDACKKNEALIKEISTKFDAFWTEGIKSNSELMKRTSRGIPYWPMLRFLNTSANSKKQFKRIAGDLELGKDCPINVSENANYSLETPINSFVWKCLRHFQNACWVIEHNMLPTRRPIQSLNPVWEWVDVPAKTFEEAAENYVIKKIPSPATGRPITAGFIKREGIPIYKEICKLDPLTKSNAETWADKAVMPYVKIEFPDLRKVPELSAINTGRDGKRYSPVRKAVIQSLEQMARKA
jgi:hypothetical protein